MYCKVCGKKLEGTEKFCSDCGNPIDYSDISVTPNDAPSKSSKNDGFTFSKSSFHMDGMDWDLEGYPTDEKKTDRVDFDWASVLEGKEKKAAEERRRAIAMTEEDLYERIQSDRHHDEFDWNLVHTMRLDRHGRSDLSLFHDDDEELFSVDFIPPLNTADSYENMVPEEKPAPAHSPSKGTIVIDRIDKSGIEAAASQAAGIKERDYAALGINTDAPAPKTSSRPAGRKIEKFYTFNRKNEEFQALLDEEYERIRKKVQEQTEKEELKAAVEHAFEEGIDAAEAEGAIDAEVQTEEVIAEPAPLTRGEVAKASAEAEADEAERLAEEAERLAEEAAAKARAAEEAAAKAAAEAQAAEEALKALEEEEARAAEEAARLAAEEEARAAEQARLAEEAARIAREEEARVAAEAEAQAAEEARLAAEAQAAEEARLAAEAEAAEEARLAAEAQAAEEARLAAEAAAIAAAAATLTPKEPPVAETPAQTPTPAPEITSERYAEVSEDLRLKAALAEQAERLAQEEAAIDAELEKLNASHRALEVEAARIEAGMLASEEDEEVEEVEEEQAVEVDRKKKYEDIFDDEDDDDYDYEKRGGCKTLILDIIIVILLIIVGISCLLIFLPDHAISRKIKSYIPFFNQSAIEQVDPAPETPVDEDPQPEPEPEPQISDTAAAINKFAAAITNLGTVSEDQSILFTSGTDYGIEGIEQAAPFTNSAWYSAEDGTEVTYIDAAVDTVLSYYSKLMGKLNEDDSAVMELISEDSQLYGSLSAISANPEIVYSIEDLKIGEIRSSESDFYVLVRVTEKLSTEDAPEVRTELVHMQADGANTMKIMDVVHIQ